MKLINIFKHLLAAVTYMKSKINFLLIKTLLILSIPFQVYGSNEHEKYVGTDTGSESADILISGEQRYGYVANEVIVRLKPGFDRSSIQSLGSAHGVVIIDEIPQLNAYLLRIPHTFGMERAIRDYDDHPYVRYAEPNLLGRGTDVIPDDTYFSRQWHLNNTGQSYGTVDADIDAPEGWEITRGHDSVVIAVLDTGIAFDHPEFAGRLLPGWDWVNEDDDPTADHQHGVYVTGILAATAS